MVSLQGERSVFYARLYKKAEERAIQHRNSCHERLARAVDPPSSPFLLAQNLSSKRIATTDNMRPNFDDDYSRHSHFLKG